MDFREKSILWRRYMAFLTDALISMAGIFLICDLVLNKIFGLENNRVISSIWGCAVFLVLITRDVLGRSLGKRIFGLKIVSILENQTPQTHHLILRNLFFFLLPIEALMVIARPDHRRIGDILAKTQVLPINVGGKNEF